MARKYSYVDDEIENNEDETKNIENETKVIFECYIEDSLEKDKSSNVIDPGTPGIKIEKLLKVDNKKCWHIGKELIKLSEKLNIENEPVIQKVLNMVNVSSGMKGAFKDFSEVAERVLNNRVNLESIVYLFRFGYLIARDRLVQGAQDFLAQLCQWIIDVFRQFSVFRWILGQGGWDALMQLNTSNMRPIVIVASAAAIIAIIGIVWFKLKKT